MKLKEKVKRIKKDITRIYIAFKMKETPWYAKAIGGIAIAYALSPIDLIPDFIPVLGYLDDVIILPLLIIATVKLIPEKIWEETEQKVGEIWVDGKPKKWYFAIPIVLIWIIVILVIGYSFIIN